MWCGGVWSGVRDNRVLQWSVECYKEQESGET